MKGMTFKKGRDMKYIIGLLLLLMIGCAEPEMVKVYTAPFITKDTFISYPNRIENTPFEWQGEHYMMVSTRPDLGDTTTSHGIEIYDQDKNLISFTPVNLMFGSVYSENGTLHFFGTQLDRTRIYKMTTIDLVNWSSPVLVKDYVSGRKVYNTSVTKTDTGYTMAFETCEKGTECFNVRFLKSTNLVNWTEQPRIFSSNEYAACPTIRFIDGVYYMMYLRDFNGHWATVVVRSTDLSHWEGSPIVALSALNTPGETVNNSDADIIEINGQTHISYGIGDQASFSHIKYAHYNGTMKQFFMEFF